MIVINSLLKIMWCKILKKIIFFTFGVNFAQEAWLICSSAFNAAGLTVC